MPDIDRNTRQEPGPPPGIQERPLYKWLLSLWRAFRAMRGREREGIDGSFEDNDGRTVTVRRGRITRIE